MVMRFARIGSVVIAAIVLAVQSPIASGTARTPRAPGRPRAPRTSRRT